MCRYFADGNELAFIFRLGDSPEDFPTDMVAALGEDFVFRLFLRRK